MKIQRVVGFLFILCLLPAEAYTQSSSGSGRGHTQSRNRNRDPRENCLRGLQTLISEGHQCHGQITDPVVMRALNQATGTQNAVVANPVDLAQWRCSVHRQGAEIAFDMGRCDEILATPRNNSMEIRMYREGTYVPAPRRRIGTNGIDIDIGTNRNDAGTADSAADGGSPPPVISNGIETVR